MVTARWFGPGGIFPSHCLSCDRRLNVGDSGAWCEGCGAAVQIAARWWPLHSDGGVIPVWAAFAYGGPVIAAIRAVKFDGAPPRVDSLVDDLAASLADLPSGPLTFVAIPPVRSRLIERGFHLPDLLAGDLMSRRSTTPGARRAPWRLRRVLRRTDAAAPRARGRVEAPQFAVRADDDGLAVVLIDDVVTTGETLIAATDALRSAGARVVAAICLADARPCVLADLDDADPPEAPSTVHTGNSVPATRQPSVAPSMSSKAAARDAA